MQKALWIAMILFMLPATAAADDDCEDAGKLGAMLGQIDQQCPDYRLTPAGKRVMMRMATKVTANGGDVCIAKGKIAMLEQLGTLFPQVEVAAATGNSELFSMALCDAIAKYLDKLDDRLTERIR